MTLVDTLGHFLSAADPKTEGGYSLVTPERLAEAIRADPAAARAIRDAIDPDGLRAALDPHTCPRCGEYRDAPGDDCAECAYEPLDADDYRLAAALGRQTGSIWRVNGHAVDPAVLFQRVAASNPARPDPRDDSERAFDAAYYPLATIEGTPDAD